MAAGGSAGSESGATWRRQVAPPGMDDARKRRTTGSERSGDAAHRSQGALQQRAVTCAAVSLTHASSSRLGRALRRLFSVRRHARQARRHLEELLARVVQRPVLLAHRRLLPRRQPVRKVLLVRRRRRRRRHGLQLWLGLLVVLLVRGGPAAGAAADGITPVSGDSSRTQLSDDTERTKRRLGVPHRGAHVATPPRAGNEGSRGPAGGAARRASVAASRRRARVPRSADGDAARAGCRARTPWRRGDAALPQAGGREGASLHTRT